MNSQSWNRVYWGLGSISGSSLLFLSAIALFVPGVSAKPLVWSAQPTPPSSTSPTWQTIPASKAPSPQWQNLGQPATTPSSNSPSWTSSPAVPATNSLSLEDSSVIPEPGAIAVTYFQHQTPPRLSPLPKREGINAEQLSAYPAVPNPQGNPQPLTSAPSLSPQDSVTSPTPVNTPPAVVTAPNPESNAQDNLAPAPLPSESPDNSVPASPETELPEPSPAPKYSLTPLQLPPTQLINLETANVLPKGSLVTAYGSHIFPKDQYGSGTGLQTYSLSIKGGITDTLQLGLDWVLFDDTLGQSFTNGVPDLGLTVFAPTFKYQFLHDKYFSLAVAGSLEIGKFTGSYGLYTPNNLQQTTTTIGGTIQLPFTYNISSNFQWHFVPGAVFWPNTINNGGNFYGTFLNLGTGFNFKLVERLTVFADVNVPLSGGNAVNNQGQIIQKPVWAAGVTFLQSPTVGIDLYATNALGSTPATQTLAFIPNGNQVAAGVNIRYTPDLGQNYAASFRKTPTIPLSVRDKQLLFNGITLTSADNLQSGMVSLQGGVGPDVNFQLSYGMSDNAQLEFVGQQLAESNQPTGNSLKLGVGTKLQLLDQVQGDPFSLGIRGILEESIAQSDGVGIFAAELAFLYQVNPEIALIFNPKSAFFGSNTIIGAGFGFNYEVFKGIQFIGEVTPILSGNVQKTVWAGGLRYFNPDWNAGIDIYGTNGVGTYGIGGLIGQSDNQVSVGFNLLLLFGGKSKPSAKVSRSTPASTPVSGMQPNTVLESTEPAALVVDPSDSGAP